MNAIEIESSTSYDVDTCFLRQLFEEDWVPTNAMRCYLFNIRLNKEEGPVLFCFVLFCFVLFCFVLFCFVLFCFVLFCFVLFCFVLFCFVLFCFVLFCFVLFCFVLFCFVHTNNCFPAILFEEFQFTLSYMGLIECEVG